MDLTVGAIGVPNPTYQWQKDGTNVPGATSAEVTEVTEVTNTTPETCMAYEPGVTAGATQAASAAYEAASATSKAFDRSR